MTVDLDWSRAVCLEGPPDALFVTGAAQNRAKQVCLGCPIRVECLAEAMAEDIQWGVWGGLTERERRKLHRAHPNRDWRQVIEHAAAG